MAMKAWVLFLLSASAVFAQTNKIFSLRMPATNVSEAMSATNDADGIQSRPLPDFGIMFNDDGAFSFTDINPAQSKVKLREMIHSLAGTPVRTLIYGAASGDILHYPGEAGSIFGWNPTTKDTEWPWAERIAAAKARIDAVRIAGEEAKSMGMYFIPALRMNDAHFTFDPTNNPLTGEFWMNNQNLSLGVSPSDRDTDKYVLDYSHPEVREYRLAVIREVIERYSDVMDGLQLDFMKQPFLFPPGTDKQWAAGLITTGLITEVRASLDEAGRKEGRFLSLHVRVPPTLSNCTWACLDVAKWITNRLVDVVIPAQTMTLLHDLPVDQFVALAQPAGAKVCPAVFNRNQFTWPFVSEPEATNYAISANRQATSSQVRGAAVNYLNRGASGFELYNINLPPRAPSNFYDLLNALNDPWDGDRDYVVPPAHARDYEDTYEYRKQIPADLQAGSTARVSMVIGDTLSGANSLALRLGLCGVTALAGNNLAVTLNGTDVYNGPVSNVALPVTGKHSSRGTNLHPKPAEIYVQWPISPAIVVRGTNTITVTLGLPASNSGAQLVEAQVAVFDAKDAK